MSMPESIRIAMGEKQARDNERMLQIASKLDGREGGSGAAALQLAFAAPTSVERSTLLPMSVATAPVSLEPTVEPATTASVAPAASAATEPTAFASTEPPTVSAPAMAAVSPAPTVNRHDSSDCLAVVGYCDGTELFALPDPLAGLFVQLAN